MLSLVKQDQRGQKLNCKRESIPDMKNFFAHCFLLLAAGIIFTLPTLAQNKINFHGQVVDDTDAVIPGAQITLTAANGQTRTVVADGSGSYAIPDVATGLYQLKVAFDGFQPFAKNDLQIAAATASFKVTMKIAEVSEVTTVSAEDPTDTTDPEKNMSAIVLDEKFIETLADNPDDLRAQLEGLVGGGGGQGGARPCRSQTWCRSFAVHRATPTAAGCRARPSR